MTTTTHVFERTDQLELFAAHAAGIDAAFWEFHLANPHVYELLVRFARQAKRAGRRRFGMKMLFERVRWYTDIETESKTRLKVNNNFISRYARLLMQQEPCELGCEGCDNENCLAGMFELRELQTPSDLDQ